MSSPESPAISGRVAELERLVRELQDRNEILELAARYQQLCDGGWDHPTHGSPDALADLFVPEAEYLVGEPPPRQGREAIRDRFAELQFIPWVVHYLANPIVVVDGDRAMAQIKGLVQSFHEQARWRHCTYHGEFARTAYGWRFVSWISRMADLPE